MMAMNQSFLIRFEQGVPHGSLFSSYDLSFLVFWISFSLKRSCKGLGTNYVKRHVIYLSNDQYLMI